MLPVTLAAWPHVDKRLRRRPLSVYEGRKSTPTEENISYGIRKKIHGKNREFQAVGR
jgi:hypothetical protein